MDVAAQPFSELLVNIDRADPRAWVYLQAAIPWQPDSVSAVIESEEVPPELEDEPEAGVPDFARRNGLVRVLPVTVLQDAVRNARSQRANVSSDDLFAAFDFYRRNDAFIAL